MKKLPTFSQRSCGRSRFEEEFSNQCWSPRNDGEPVLMTLGGGHYAPKANKLGLEDNVWIGHMLANHSLPFGSQENPGILWRQSIEAALLSTQKAFPGGNIVCNVEKKIVQGWQRQLIYNHLESLGIEVVRSNAFLEMVKGCLDVSRTRRSIHALETHCSDDITHATMVRTLGLSSLRCGINARRCGNGHEAP